MRRRWRAGVLAAAALLAGGIVASAAPGSSPQPTPPVLPASGGTLRVVSDGPVSWTTASGEPTAAAAELMRLSSRQLVSFDGADTLGHRGDANYDAAAFCDPSDDKTSFICRLRPLRYAPPLKATLKPADFVFGIKLLCDPAHLSADAARLTTLLAGYATFCAGMRALPAGDETAVKAYADSHDVAGLKVLNDTQLQLRLNAAAGDLFDLLARPDFTPFPESAFSPATGVVSWVQAPSLGPYVRHDGAGGTMTFTRNTNWDASQDQFRRAWADTVTVTPAATEAAAAQQVASGQADVLLPAPGLASGTETVDLPAVTGGTTRTTPAGDEVALLPAPASGACGRALEIPAVRQALAIGVDHRPVAAAVDGDPLSWPVPDGQAGDGGAPPVAGKEGADGPGTVNAPTANAVDSPGSGGDPAQARQMLADAGIKALTCGVAAVDAATGDPDPSLGAAVAALTPAYAAMGLKLRVVAPTAADLVVERLTAPWRGDGTLELLSGVLEHATDPDVAAAVLRATQSSDQNLAAAQWAIVSTLLLSSGDIVPLAEDRVATLTSTRLRSFRWFGPAGGPDLANASLG